MTVSLSWLELNSDDRDKVRRALYWRNLKRILGRLKLGIRRETSLLSRVATGC